MFNKIRPLIFKLNPELAHNLAIKALKLNYFPKRLVCNISSSVTENRLLGRKLYFKDFIAKSCAVSGSRLNTKGLKKENIKIIFSTFFPLNQLSL